MTDPRRAPLRLVVGAALAALLALAGCSDGTQIDAVSDLEADAPTADATVTPVATTAPAVPSTPQLAAPSPVAVPTSLPIDIEPTAVEATATAVPTVAAPEPSAASPQPRLIETPPSVAPTPVLPTPSPPTDSQTVQAANGAEIYTFTCARCHGENGRGSAQYSAPLIGVGSKFTSQAMIAELTTGHPVTFGFTDRLTPDEIAAVVAYVKSVFP